MTTLNRRLYHAQEGQVLYLVALAILVILGMAAISIDIGYVLHGQRELQASADAAATAGAEDLSDNHTADEAKAIATQYSGKASENNAIKDLYNVVVTPTAKCLTTTGVCALCPCTNTVSGDNAMSVTETATAPTFFAKIFGISSINLTANALASIKGSKDAPANVFVILDSTQSMVTNDPTCAAATGIGNPTKLDCAKNGVRVLLADLDPCSSNLPTCPAATNGNVPGPVDEVSIMTFPGLTGSASSSCPYCSTSAQLEYTNCGSNVPTADISKYAASGTYPPYYMITPLASDYRSSDTASTLSCGTSNLVQSVDFGSTDGCTQGCNSSQYGIKDIGGVSTYYAGAIFEAQAYINALPSPRSSMQSAIILLSDGDAEAFQPAGDFVSGTPASAYTNPCHLAIKAAQAAAATTNAAGLYTWVYTVGYGALTSNSCTHDTPAISGCTTMQEMASDPTKFYSDDSQGCQSPDNPNITTLQLIFNSIGNDFKTTRLLPLNTN